MIFFFLWLNSLSMIFSRSVYVAANGNIDCVCMCVYLYVCVYIYMYTHILYMYIYTLLNYHLLMANWVVSMSWLLQIALLWTLRHMYLFKLDLSFFWVWVQEWCWWIIWYLYFRFFKEMSILFFIMVAPIYILTNSVGGFSYLHTLSSIYCLWQCWQWPFLPRVRWHRILVLVCISLLINNVEQLFLYLLICMSSFI